MSRKKHPTPKLHLRRVPLGTLRHDPGNARKHGKRNLQAIGASLKRFGQVEPLVVNQRTGRVIGGNARLQVLHDQGAREVDVVEIDLEDAEAAALGIALNRTAELAEWDSAALGKILAGLDAMKCDLAAIGFDERELNELIAPVLLEGQSDPDMVPAPPDEALTQCGDLWILGEHRLLCGDAGSALDVDRLLDGQPVHLVNTDPPYNVKVEPRSNNALALAAARSSFGEPGLKNHQSFDVARQGKKRATTKKLRAKDRPLINDFVSEEQFNQLLHAWFGQLARVLLPGRSFYIWGGYANCGNYPPVLKACELYFSQAIIWVKEHPVLTRKDFMGNHEWCFYGWREGAAHRFFGPHNATDVWSVKKVNPNAMVHLTQKPTELAVRAMQYSSRAGENVLDLFGGSGFTLTAAHQTGRKAFLMELDPLYCDIIVQRWEGFTGQKGHKKSTDQLA